MDTFHLTRETETGTLECIYTTRNKAWAVDDCIRDTTVHLNHHDLVSYVSFNNNKKKKLSLSVSLSLWKALSFYPHISMKRLLSSYKLFALTLLEKLYRLGGNRTRFNPHIMKCICYGHSLLVSGVSSLKRITLQCEDVTPYLPGYK